MMCAVFLAAVLASGATWAQQDAAGSGAAPQETTAAPANEEKVATVETEKGDIMISEAKSPFATAELDQRVTSKARLMVAKESIAKVTYDNGCEVTYDEPGVYEIGETCPVAAFWTTGKVVTAGVAGGLLLGGIIGHRFCDDCDCPPVSR